MPVIVTPPTTEWKYRTKEFNFGSNSLKQLRRLRVVYEGDLTIEVYRDNKLTSIFNLSSSGKTEDFFYVKGLRGYTFSIRFIGNQDTILYKYSFN